MPDTQLRHLIQQRDHIELLIESQVAHLREDGVPWAEIAEALGVSRQAAHQRYANSRFIQ